ncbi:MAG: transglutaminase-like domain-containing protein [Candidatus Omnitrophota bacterium]
MKFFIKKADPGKLPHLLKLLDDDSALVRRAVSEELLAFGPDLEDELGRLRLPAPHAVWRQIESLLDEYQRSEFKTSWGEWKKIKAPGERLEAMLAKVAFFVSGWAHRAPLKKLLDDLAAEYNDRYDQRDPKRLADFLFGLKKFKGAKKDYYDPGHNDLIHVILERRGIPITLTSLYMLVGARLGIAIEGCNFPGHFLAKVELRNETALVDCFNGGRIMTPEEWVPSCDESLLAQVLSEPATPEQMAARILNNLQHAYRLSGDTDRAAYAADLLRSSFLND